ncbi:hypothetical protein QUA82_22045 [Microcoleus sp. F8-D3]
MSDRATWVPDTHECQVSKREGGSANHAIATIDLPDYRAKIPVPRQ